MFRKEMGSKTPASILQEMCIRKGSPPQYDLIHDGGATHEALFKYQVTVGEVSGIFTLLLRNALWFSKNL
jgi:hypothetical protein